MLNGIVNIKSKKYVFYTCIVDENLSDTVLKGSKLSEITESKTKKSKYKLSTDLKYIEYYNSKICKCITSDVGGKFVLKSYIMKIVILT